MFSFVGDAVNSVVDRIVDWVLPMDEDIWKWHDEDGEIN